MKRETDPLAAARSSRVRPYVSGTYRAAKGEPVLLVYFTIAWASGISLAYALWNVGALDCTTPVWPVALAALGVTVAGFAFCRRLPWRRAMVITLFVIFGAWRCQVHLRAACPTPQQLAFYNGGEASTTTATVEGVVTSYPDAGDARTDYHLRAEKVTIAGRSHAVRGDLLVQAGRYPEYGYGDRLRVTGFLQAPPVLDDFDYAAFLARQGIYSIMRRARVEQVGAGQGRRFWQLLFDLKARGAALLNRVLPEPAAALANGMLLGIESGIPDDLSEAFAVTGTSHVIVISGSNIVLFSGVLMTGLSRLVGKRRAVWPVMIGIMSYVLLVGADPPALRAGLMGVLYVFAVYLGRQSTSYVSLCAAGLLMTALNPLALFEAGFQLSFAAALSLVLFTPAIRAFLGRTLRRWLDAKQARHITGLLADTVIVTLAAQVLALPFIVYYFGRLSPVSLLTNLLILPVQPLIMSGGMATVIFGIIWEPVGRVLAAIPWLFLTYTTAVVRLAAAVPLASVETGSFGQAAALAYLGGLLAVGLWRAAYQRGWTAIPAHRAFGWAAAAAIPVWLGATALQALPDGRLHVFFVPGEDGEAVLFVTPDGQQVWLWDGRGDGEALADAAQPFLRRPGRGVDAAIGPPGASRWPATRTIDPAQLAVGARIRLAEDVMLTRLASDAQAVLALEHQRFRLLLPTTLSVDTQAGLLAQDADLHVTLLKAPGPGTGAWPAAGFLAAAAPQVVLWPQDTTYPPDVAGLLTARGALRAPPDAILEAITDGERLWLRQHAPESRR